MKKVALIIFLGFIVLLSGCTKTNQQTTQQKQGVDNITKQEQKTITTSDEFSDWKTYQDKQYGYQFKFPNHWNLAGVHGDNTPGSYNVTIREGDGISKDNIQIVKATYGGTNADGSINDRDSHLKRLNSEKYTKFPIAKGQGYYYVNTESKAGPTPSLYLVNDENTFLMSFNIWNSSLADAEKLLKQIASSFKF